MTAKHGRREDRFLPDMDMPPAAAWGPHEPSECDHCVEDVDHIDVSVEDRVTFRQQQCRGVLIDFALIHRRRVGDGWVDVITVDCGHEGKSYVHAHRHDQRGRRVGKTTLVLPLLRAEDVAEGCNRAEALVYDEMSKNVERWSRER